MTKHTQGPWKACRSNEDFHGFIFESDRLFPYTRIESENETVVCCHDLATISEANARLIAAAPELLEALEIMLNVYSGQLPRIDSIARAAIAKAKGEKL